MDLSHLDAEQKSKFISDLEEKISNVDSHVDIAPDVATVESLREVALAAILGIERSAEEKDGEVFVEELMPLIIALIVIGAVEAIIAVGLFIYRRNTALALMLPMAAPALALTPASAQVVAIALVIVDLALAIYIGYSIVLLVLAWKKRKESDGEEEVTYEELRDIEELSLDFEPEEENVIEEEPEPEIEQVEKIEEVIEPESEPITDLMYEPMVMSDVVDEITVEEADEMMSDEEAKNFEQLEINFVPEFREEYHGTKKAEINVDTLSACFEAGDKVTLNTLKEKGLVSNNVGSVKVLARGRLDKPLVVVAQKFSAAAVKMIVLTGGSVIIAEPAPERAKK
jgi:ribosomal protein L18E